MSRRTQTTLAAFFLAAFPAAAAAKVTFTGYGDLRYNAGANITLEGPTATLSKLGVAPEHASSRGFNANAIGLFATTQIQEDLQFLSDITFRSIGNTVGQLQVQYAYLDWTPRSDSRVRAGRVTLPFGFFNENRFYAFQRYQVTAPVFQSAILGLPIADWGVTGAQTFHLSKANLEAVAYVVNGYGNATAQKAQLRSASIPGGISLSNNLAATDNNHKPALGGRLSLRDIGGKNLDTGVSYYWGDWDASGLEPMYMVDAHLHAAAAGFDLLFEALHIGVRGDHGFSQSIGSTDWSTDGGFATLSYDRINVAGAQLAPYVQYESYRSRPNNGDATREILEAGTVGAALKLSPQLMLKAEYLHLGYLLPDVATGGSTSLRADQTQLAAVVTF